MTSAGGSWSIVVLRIKRWSCSGSLTAVLLDVLHRREEENHPTHRGTAFLSRQLNAYCKNKVSLADTVGYDKGLWLGNLLSEQVHERHLKILRLTIGSQMWGKPCDVCTTISFLISVLLSASLVVLQMSVFCSTLLTKDSC